MAIYTTEIQWGGHNAEWRAEGDLEVQIKSNNKDVIGDSAPPAGTAVSWSGPNGSAQVTFFTDPNGTNLFSGAAHFPGEGPVGFRGKKK